MYKRQIEKSVHSKSEYRGKEDLGHREICWENKLQQKEVERASDGNRCKAWDKKGRASVADWYQKT